MEKYFKLLTSVEALVTWFSPTLERDVKDIKTKGVVKELETLLIIIGTPTSVRIDKPVKYAFTRAGYDKVDYPVVFIKRVTASEVGDTVRFEITLDDTVETTVAIYVKVKIIEHLLSSDDKRIAIIRGCDAKTLNAIQAYLNALVEINEGVKKANAAQWEFNLQTSSLVTKEELIDYATTVHSSSAEKKHLLVPLMGKFISGFDFRDNSGTEEKQAD